MTLSPGAQHQVLLPTQSTYSQVLFASSLSFLLHPERLLLANEFLTAFLCGLSLPSIITMEFYLGFSFPLNRCSSLWPDPYLLQTLQGNVWRFASLWSSPNLSLVFLSLALFEVLYAHSSCAPCQLKDTWASQDPTTLFWMRTTPTQSALWKLRTSLELSGHEQRDFDVL